MAYDLLITDAQILDGTGAPAFSGNVAVQDGHIVAVGDASGLSDEERHQSYEVNGQLYLHLSWQK